MRPAVAASTLASIVVFSGCLLPGTSDRAAPDEPARLATEEDLNATFAWSLTACMFSNVFITVPEPTLQEFLPEGFTIDGGYLGLEVFECSVGAGLDGPVDDMEYGSWFLRVVPPPSLAVDGIEQYYYKLDPLVPDSDRRAAFRERGMQARGGSVALDVTIPPTGGVAVVGPSVAQARLELDDVGTFAWSAVSALDLGTGEGGWFGEFTPLEDGGFATWTSAYSAHHIWIGQALVELEPGSLPAEIVGGTSAHATLNTGIWSFHDGNVSFPQ